MAKKALTVSISLLLLCLLLRLEFSSKMEARWTAKSQSSFQKIQEVINAASEGQIIEVPAGVYAENVVINKSISIVGENVTTTIIEGNNIGVGIRIEADNVTVKGFTVRNFKSGIQVFDCRNCTVTQNLVLEGEDRGILITRSQRCNISDNRVAGTIQGYGININASKNVLVEDNAATDNYFDGIGLLQSSDCIITGNTANDNRLLGIWVDSSINNLFYHNNVFRNGILGSPQVRSNTAVNFWDNGSEGNYWGDYAGVDEKKGIEQNINGSDGLGDEPYPVDIETQQQDNYPLIHPHSNQIFKKTDLEPPIATFTATPESGVTQVNDDVFFNASDSYDLVGNNAIVGYYWNFGDGNEETGETTSHSYQTSGNYTVTLTLVDAAANDSNVSKLIEVQQRTEPDEKFPLWIIGVIVVFLAAGLTAAFIIRKKTD